MGQSLSKVYLHIVFSTKNRHPFITTDIRDEVHKYLGGVAKQHDSSALMVGGVADHIHMLCVLNRTQSQSSLLMEIKRASSLWIKQRFKHMNQFAWQGGYGAFSVDPSNLDAVIAYIKNQEEHHRVRTFQEEYRLIMTRYKVEWDEKYVWD